LSETIRHEEFETMNNTRNRNSRQNPRRAGQLVRRSLIAALMAAAVGGMDAGQIHHDIIAANIKVVQNAVDNNAAAVTDTMPLRIGDFRIRDTANRGDIDVQIGDDVSDDYLNGLLITSVAENGRDNGEGTGTLYATSSAHFTASATPPVYWIPTGDTTSGRAEINVNVGAAWFPYSSWIAGTFNNPGGANGGPNDNIVASPGIEIGKHFIDLGAGRSTVDLTSLGIDSRTNGILLTLHAKNEGNFSLSHVNDDGTWSLFVKDNNANGSSYEQDPVEFLYIPKTNTTVVAGRFRGDGTILMHTGDAPAFNIRNTDTGRWQLTIPGYSSTNGVLIVTAEGGETENLDNFVTYQPSGDGWEIQSRDLPNSTLETPGGGREPVASFVFVPAPSPGVTVKSSQTAQTTEGAGTFGFTVELDTQPTNDVVLTLSSSDVTEGVLSTGTLTFTPDDWNIPRSVTVTGQDDSEIDGAVVYAVTFAAASGDATYDHLVIAGLSLVNLDNESGVTVSPTLDRTTTEAGGTDTFMVRLNTQPTGDVTVPIASGTPGEVSAAPSELVFTSVNWNRFQTVTVTGVDDAFDDGDQPFSVKVGPSASTDAAYTGLSGLDATGINADDDTAGVDLQPITVVSVLEGGAGSFSVVLKSAPAAKVVVVSESTLPDKCTVSPATITFTSSNWNVPQTVTIRGVDNRVADGDQTCSITTTVISTDTVYAAIDPVDVPVLVVDNEPAFFLPTGSVVYSVGSTGIGIDGRAALTDADSTSYDGGSLTITLTTNGSASDRLEVRNTGTGAGQIGVSGSDVTYAGATVGAFSGGSGNDPLVVSFNGASSPEAAQALVRAVVFRVEGNNPSIAPRSLSVFLLDGVGGSASGAASVRIVYYRLAEFQEGVDGGHGTYLGEADTAISEAAPDTALPQGTPNDGLLLDWPDSGQPNSSQVLMRFDHIFGTGPGQIPAGATIVSAELLLGIKNSGDGGTFHRMRVEWDATNATWNSVGGGFYRDDVNVRYGYDSQLGLVDGTGSTGTGTVSVGVTPDVQAWAHGEANFGWLMTGWDFNTDGTGILPGETEVSTDRPKLRIVWLPAGALAASYRQDVDGFTGVHDTRLLQTSPDDDLSAVEVLWSDAHDSAGTNESQFLIRFDNIVGPGAGQVPSGARVVAAWLDLASVAGNAMGDGGQFFTMKQDWTDTTATWSSTGGGLQPDGTEASTVANTGAGNASRNPNVQGSFNSFDVTGDLQAWVSGSQANYGWAVVPWAGGTDGWGVGSSEAVEERERPRLRVYYTMDAAPETEISLTSIARNGASYEIQITAGASKTLSVERAPAVTGPWTSAGSLSTDASGKAIYTDSTPLPEAGFYRVVKP
jgi:hypothetical protein